MRLSGVLGRFAKDERASVAVLYAVLLLATLAASGLAIDYAAAYNRRAKFDSAADAAVLAAVKAAQDAFKSGKSDWQDAAIAAANTVFEQNSKMALASGGTAKAVGIVVNRKGNEFDGSLSYRATYPTAIMKLFHNPVIELSNTVKSHFALANYIDVHLLIDVSPSMGIGASVADQTTLQNTIGCALVCHQNGADYATARASGARTRIDIVRDAVRQLIDDLKARRTKADQVRLSIDLFSNDIIPLFAPSTDLDAAFKAAANIDLQTYPAFGTNISYSLSRLNQTLPAGGDGYRDDSRKSFFVLLSDGIEDSRYQPVYNVPEIMDPNFVPTLPEYTSGSERLQSMEATSCDGIKGAGHTMMTAKIDYLIPPMWMTSARDRFDFIQDTLIAKSELEFRNCASSPDYAFKAGDSKEIAPMFDEILNTIMAPADLRLSN